MTFAQMMEGPKHFPHVRQVQVGWLGQTGAFYPWGHEPGRDEEPGSYMPVYIDEEEGPERTYLFGTGNRRHIHDGTNPHQGQCRGRCGGWFYTAADFLGGRPDADARLTELLRLPVCRRCERARP